MSYTLPPITLTENQTSYITIPGNLGSVSWVKIVNASPYLVSLSGLLGGGSDYLQPGEANVWNVPGLTTAIQAAALPFVSNAATPPSSVIVVTWYLEGEQPQGAYPVNFNLLTFNGGNVGVASQLVNDGSSVGTNVIEVTPTGSGVSYILVKNDGTFDVQSLSNGTLTDILHLTAGDATHAAKLVLELLQTIGALSLDSGKIVTDGNGMMTFSSAFARTTLDITQGGPTDSYWRVQVLSPSIAGALGFDMADGGGLHTTPFGILDGGALVDAQMLSYVQGGVLHAKAPVTLLAGNQETGVAGFSLFGQAGHNVSIIINFKTVLTNVLTSITTVNLSTPTNASGLSFNLFTIYGANMFWTVGATADTGWNVKYTTAGNCLLAVDTAAHTFDHHCDGCGAVRRGVALSEVSVTPGATPPEHALHYTCPTCGTSEHYNGALGAADETDSSPQGSGEYATTRGAQATLIRALMQALNIEVAS